MHTCLQPFCRRMRMDGSSELTNSLSEQLSEQPLTDERVDEGGSMRACLQPFCSGMRVKSAGREAGSTCLLAALLQRDKDGGLHGLRGLVDDDHVEAARHVLELAAAGEGERRAHDVRALQDGALQALARARARVAALREPIRRPLQL